MSDEQRVIRIPEVMPPAWLFGKDGKLATTMPNIDRRDGTLHFLVPSGIGDVAWIWSKLWKVAEDRKVEFHFPYDPTDRVKPYADWVGMPRGRDMPIDIRALLDAPGSLPVSEFDQDGGVYYIHANKHLEQGKPLAKWFPELEFRNPVPPPGKLTAQSPRVPADTVAVYMSSPTYMEGNWFPALWAKLLRRIECDYQRPVMLVGANWDAGLIRNVLRYYTPRLKPMLNRPLPMVIDALSACDRFIGLASGLTILSAYRHVPTLMAYPRWLKKMPGSWELGNADKYVTSCFVDELMDAVELWMWSEG